MPAQFRSALDRRKRQEGEGTSGSSWLEVTLTHVRESFKNELPRRRCSCVDLLLRNQTTNNSVLHRQQGWVTDG